MKVCVYLEELFDSELLKKLKEMKQNVEIQFEEYWQSDILNEDQTKQFVEIVNELKQEGIECAFADGTTVEQALVASRKFNDWVNEIKDARIVDHGKERELSPLEKFLYAYEIASEFEYKEEKSYESEWVSRNLIKVLTGDKIVCTGYANLLARLCKELDIPCRQRVLIDTKRNSSHAICIVAIDDPIYNIKRTFYSDPCHDIPLRSRKQIAQLYKDSGHDYCFYNERKGRYPKTENSKKFEYTANYIEKFEKNLSCEEMFATKILKQSKPKPAVLAKAWKNVGLAVGFISEDLNDFVETKMMVEESIDQQLKEKG